MFRIDDPCHAQIDFCEILDTDEGLQVLLRLRCLVGHGVLLVFGMALPRFRRRLQAFLVGVNHRFDQLGVEAGREMLVSVDA